MNFKKKFSVSTDVTHMGTQNLHTKNGGPRSNPGGPQWRVKVLTETPRSPNRLKTKILPIPPDSKIAKTVKIGQKLMNFYYSSMVEFLDHKKSEVSQFWQILLN